MPAMLLEAFLKEVEDAADTHNMVGAVIDYFDAAYQRSLANKPETCNHHDLKAKYVYTKMLAHKVGRMFRGGGTCCLYEGIEDPEKEERYRFLLGTARRLREEYRATQPCGYCTECCRGARTKVRVPGFATKADPRTFAPQPLFLGVAS